jgi:nucleotide-binding universal stress UspA family protein
VKGFSKILFPVDLSDISIRIVPYVHAMAEKFDAEVHLLFVAQMLEEFSDLYIPDPAVRKFEAEILEGAEKRLADFGRACFQDCRSYTTKVTLGNVAEEILAYVDAQGIDLVVLGTHGRKGLDRLLFGSVAEKVVKMSPVPVLSVNPYRITP